MTALLIDLPIIDPVAFYIGPWGVRWYGLMYLAGFILGFLFLQQDIKNKRLPLSQDQLVDYIFYAAMGVILGGRIGYIIFYNLAFYIQNPLRVFAIWEGGMSLHGGVLGVLIATLFFLYRHPKLKLNFVDVGDRVIKIAPFALFLGRIGNFLNSELYGPESHLPWAMKFPGIAEYRHPTQLYEALLFLLIFIVLLIIDRYKLRPGILLATFFILYSTGRFFTEMIRDTSFTGETYFGLLTMGQILSIIFFLWGTWLITQNLRMKGKQKGEGEKEHIDFNGRIS